MPIKQPITALFEIVSLSDDALDEVPAEVMRAYESSRAISVLDDPWKEYDDDGAEVPADQRRVQYDGLQSIGAKPTRVKCKPLMVTHQHRVGLHFDASDAWQIFLEHVENITNYQDADGMEIDVSRWYTGNGNKRRMKSKVRNENLIPYAFVNEIAAVIIQKGTQGQDSFFTPQGTWAVSRQSRAHAARVAMVKKAANIT